MQFPSTKVAARQPVHLKKSTLLYFLSSKVKTSSECWNTLPELLFWIKIAKIKLNCWKLIMIYKIRYLLLKKIKSESSKHLIIMAKTTISDFNISFYNIALYLEVVPIFYPLFNTYIFISSKKLRFCVVSLKSTHDPIKGN